MSNELVLSNDLNIITAEINSYKQVAGQAIFEIGRRLKKVHDEKLAEKHGGWTNWLREVEMSTSQADRFIKVTSEFNGKFPTSGSISFGKLYEIATLPEKQRDMLHELKSGETKTVDEMTVRELREVKKALKEAEEEKRKLEQELHNEKNKPVKVETKYIEKEIDNTDYDSIERLNNQISNMKNKIESVERQRELLQQRLKQEEKDADEYRRLKKELEDLYSKKDDLHRQIESATSISGLVVEIEDMLRNKLAPVKYSRAVSEQRNDEIVIGNLKETVSRVMAWCDEMNKMLPKYNINTIEAEVIEYE